MFELVCSSGLNLQCRWEASGGRKAKLSTEYDIWIREGLRCLALARLGEGGKRRCLVYSSGLNLQYTTRLLPRRK